MTVDTLEAPRPRPGAGRAFVFWSAGDAASKLAVLVTTIIAARALSPIDFAVFIALSAIVILASTVLDAGSSVVVAREVAAQRLSEKQAVVEALALRVKTLPASLIVFVLGLLVLGPRRIPDVAIIAFAFASLLAGMKLMSVALLQAQLRFAALGAATSAGRWVTAFLALAVFAVQSNQRLIVLGFATAAGEATTVAIAITLALLRRRSVVQGSARIDLRASIPFAVNSLLGLAYNRFDVLIVAALTSAVQLAAYVPASRVQDALYLVPTALGSVALPLIASAWQRGEGAVEVRRLVRTMIIGGLVLALPTAALTYVFAPGLLDGVLGERYTGAVTATRILVWFLPFAVVTAPPFAALAAIGRARDTVVVFGTTFGVAMAMHLALVPWFGATGGAIASLSRDPVGMVITLMLARRAGVLGAPRS